MTEYLYGIHTVQGIKHHNTCKGNRKKGREILIQGCKIRNVTIIEGSVGKDHLHVLIATPTNIAPSKLVQYLKCRSSKLLQEKFPELSKKYFELYDTKRTILNVGFKI